MEHNANMTLSGNKTMVQAEAKPGRTVEVANDIHSNKLEALLGADSYANFPGNTVLSFETYSGRIGKVSDALGNKDSVKG